MIVTPGSNAVMLWGSAVFFIVQDGRWWACRYVLTRLPVIPSPPRRGRHEVLRPRLGGINQVRSTTPPRRGSDSQRSRALAAPGLWGWRSGGLRLGGLGQRTDVPVA